LALRGKKSLNRSHPKNFPQTRQFHDRLAAGPKIQHFGPLIGSFICRLAAGNLWVSGQLAAIARRICLAQLPVTKEIHMKCSKWLMSVAAVATLMATQAASADDPSGLKPGNIELSSAGPLTFGPKGILFVADPVAATIYAIKTDEGKTDSPPTNVNVADLNAKLAKTLNADAAEVKVGDMAVNPTSGNVYLSVAAGKPAKASLVKIDAKGNISPVSLKEVPHSKAELPDAPESEQRRRGNPRHDSVTDLVFRDGKLLVSGLAKGQSESTVREFAFPFSDRPTATYIEIFHAAHGKVEDDAAVRTFAPLQVNGEPMLLAGFTCTPLVSIPLKSLEAGKKVRGKTVAELGNWNKPLDMVVYEKDGKPYVLMANSARGVMKISLDNIAENPGLKEPVRGGGTAGQPFEPIKELQGVEQLDLLNDSFAVVIAKSDKGSLDLTTVELP
jgi:hypothetical protein